MFPVAPVSLAANRETVTAVRYATIPIATGIIDNFIIRFAFFDIKRWKKITQEMNMIA